MMTLIPKTIGCVDRRVDRVLVGAQHGCALSRHDVGMEGSHV
jgi:hypothetical protein